MSSEDRDQGPWVYRPNDPRSNENGMLSKRLASPLVRSDSAPMVISDLAEYRAAAFDKRTGKRPMIGGRAQHREFLKANGYAELGNDVPRVRHEQLSTADRIADIKRVMGD